MVPSFIRMTLGMLVGAIFASPLHAQSVTMKLTTATINEPQHLFLIEYKKRIEERTQGRIKAEVYPSSQLGAIPRVVEGIVLGTIEGFIGPPGFFRGVEPAFQVTEVPGLFADVDRAAAALGDPIFHDPFVAIGEPKGVAVVSLWSHSPIQYASVKPIRTLADFRGKKFRTLATKMEMEAMQRVGAAGVPVDFGEMIGGLQSGAIDGVRSGIVVMLGIKVFTVAKYLTAVNDTVIPVMLAVSKPWLDKLPADLQREVRATGLALEPWSTALAKDFYAKSEQAWRDNGGEVIRLPPGDQAEFMRRVAPLGEELLGGAPDANTKRLYALLKESAARHK
jgi:TRAP-type C4-dicarboxylate transport system substrate-binding protein